MVNPPPPITMIWPFCGVVMRQTCRKMGETKDPDFIVTHRRRGTERAALHASASLRETNRLRPHGLGRRGPAAGQELLDRGEESRGLLEMHEVARAAHQQ